MVSDRHVWRCVLVVVEDDDFIGKACTIQRFYYYRGEVNNKLLKHGGGAS